MNVDHQISFRTVEIFSGTGGVGKTTLATSRALYLAQNKVRVLLITIDPARRLKEILGLKEDDAGKTIQLKAPLNLNCNLDVQLMSPHETIKRIANKSESLDVLNSRILKILTRPYGGLNEILALVEVQLSLNLEKYDSIILDTPPGSHFLDFLDGINKIRDFFDQSFIDIFNYLDDDKRSRLNTSRKMMTIFISTGVKKLLDYLSKVTGASFIEEFMKAVSAIYSTKDTFLDALKLQSKLKNNQFARWFLATAVDQNKLSEAIKLKEGANEYFGSHAVLLVNKSISEELKGWQCEDNSVEDKLKKGLIFKEENLTQGLENQFETILKFKEVMNASPSSHVLELMREWETFK